MKLDTTFSMLCNMVNVALFTIDTLMARYEVNDEGVINLNDSGDWLAMSYSLGMLREGMKALPQAILNKYPEVEPLMDNLFPMDFRVGKDRDLVEIVKMRAALSKLHTWTHETYTEKMQARRLADFWEEFDEF